MAAFLDAETQLHLPADVAHDLAGGAIVLTSNQRSARMLRLAFDSDAKRGGATLWPSPRIYVLDQWLGSLWSQLLVSGSEDRVLLNRSQEQTLWRTIISSDEQLTGLHSLDNLVNLAVDAWHRVALYNGQAQLQEAAHSEDTLAFVRWSAEFGRLCRRRRLLSAAVLPSALTSALETNLLQLPPGAISLVDFLPLPPAYTILIEQIERAGHRILHRSCAVDSASNELCVADDDASELRNAACWLRAENLRDPHARLALVVPDQSDRRLDVERALAEVFIEDIDPLGCSEVYEFSAGQPLSETAAAACAITLLNWMVRPLPVSAISTVLVSPYFGAAHPEVNKAAAEFDAFELRRTDWLRPELSLKQCIQMMQVSDRRARLQPLLECMAEAQRYTSQLPRTTGYAQWSDHFRSILSAFGWTDATERDAASHQTRRSWESALDELATLDFEGNTSNAADALEPLARIVAQTIYRPPSQHAAVQVLSPLEPGGVRWDAIWFLGADDLAWPVPLVANPLLPWAFQRRFGMPGVDPERDAESGSLLTQLISLAGSRVIFSYAVHGEDQTRRISPALSALELTPFTPAEQEPRHPFKLETIIDAEPLPPLPDKVIPGGARILELQAACGFRAFAELRLVATELESPQHGFDSKESGTIIHAVMQELWDTVSTQGALRAMPDSERTKVLRDSIEAALARSSRSAQGVWETAYVHVQRERLLRLLLPWLSVELDRPKFSVRLREERLNDVELGPLRLNVRVDRVDNTDGGPLIIDYKSGSASYKDWFGDRPSAPQLPLYAVLTQQHGLGGVAFAMLRAGKEMCLEGVAEEAGVLHKPKPFEMMSMADQVQDWKAVLESLAHDFASGRADVSPKDYPSTCTFCSQRMLCRLNPSKLGGEDEDANEQVEHGQAIDG